MSEIREIGWAVKQMRDGRRIRRAGWNGKGMWLVLVPSDGWAIEEEDPVGRERWMIVGATNLPWVGMKTADGGFVPWLCSQTDLLATDWEIAP